MNLVDDRKWHAKRDKNYCGTPAISGPVNPSTLSPCLHFECSAWQFDSSQKIHFTPRFSKAVSGRNTYVHWYCAMASTHSDFRAIKETLATRIHSGYALSYLATLIYHLAMPTTKHLLRARDAFPHLLIYLRLLFYPQGTPPSRGARHDRCDMPSHTIDALDHSLSLPPDIDLSPVNNTGTPPEHLVDTVRNLGPLLPIGCELLGQGDLKIIGSSPVDAGGFADIWVGERDDGTKVAIKSYRYYSSSSCLPTYLVGVSDTAMCSAC